MKTYKLGKLSVTFERYLKSIANLSGGKLAILKGNRYQITYNNWTKGNLPRALGKLEDMDNVEITLVTNRAIYFSKWITK